MAVVPVGLTKYRDGLFPLTCFTPERASGTIDIITEFQEIFLEKYGTRTVFPSDEFFLISGRELPPVEYYEDFPQYENGVGMFRSLIDEFEKALDSAEWTGNKRHVSIATGYSAYDIIKQLAEKVMKKFPLLRCDVWRIKNEFFGETITVSGLITATDLIKQLKGKISGEELLISKSMLMNDSPVFLDDLTVEDVEKSLNVKIESVSNDGYELLDAIMGITY